MVMITTTGDTSNTQTKASMVARKNIINEKIHNLQAVRLSTISQGQNASR